MPHPLWAGSLKISIVVEMNEIEPEVQDTSTKDHTYFKAGYWPDLMALQLDVDAVRAVFPCPMRNEEKLSLDFLKYVEFQPPEEPLSSAILVYVVDS